MMKIENHKLNKPKLKKRLSKIIFNLIAIIVIIAIMFPLVWMFTGAFKLKTDIWNIPPKWLPTEWTFLNFEKVFKVTYQYDFLSSIKNTLLVAFLATVGSLAVNTLAAYAFARIDFPFKKVLKFGF